MKNILGVIPARYASTRFPGKPLAMIAGKPMIQHVWERSSLATGLAQVIVATDDERIAETVRGFGGEAQMTSADHPTGTDRLLEVVESHPDYEGYINIQGDEPLIDPRQINILCHLLGAGETAYVATLIKKITVPDEVINPNVIKVVRDAMGRAMYFSRHPIPFLRDSSYAQFYFHEIGYMKHIGMYGYRKEAIPLIKAMPHGTLEFAESLEQLRWMERGLPIIVGETEIETKGVDAPEDIAEVERIIAERIAQAEN